MTVTDPKVVGLVRGEALNSFETEAWGRLDGFSTVAIGRRSSGPVPGLPVPARYLRSLDDLPGSRSVASRLRRRWPRAGLDQLVGLDDALADVDVVHAAETFIPWSEQAGRIAAARSKPLVLTCWETIPFLHEHEPHLLARKDFLREAATHFVVPTDRAFSALVEEGVAEARISVVPPGIDVDRYAVATQPGPVRVVVPARLIAEKGGTEAVRAWSRVSRSLTRTAELVFVGQGPHGRRIRAAADQLGVADSVVLRGGVPHAAMPQVFADATVTLLPSLTTPHWEEQFGMVLAEAMAAGSPILTTASGAIPEVVGDAALLVPPYDVDALADSLERMLSEDDLREDLAARGRERVRSRYDADVVARQLSAVYRGVTS